MLPLNEGGFAVLIATLILFLISGIAITLAMRTLHESRTSASYREIAQCYYSALGGLEEARSRLMLSGPDAVALSSVPQTAGDVLYILNNTPGDTVAPSSPGSLYYDQEYLQEFPGGSTTVRQVNSDQPHAATSYAIPYKWIRITVKTEYSSGQDVNFDGTLDSTTPVVYDGQRQHLATDYSPASWLGLPVYKLTALAVQPSGARRLMQYEVSTKLWIAPTAPVTSWGGVAINGPPGSVTVSGTDVAGSDPAPCRVAANQPAQNTSPSGPSPSSLISQMSPYAIPILAADPADVSFDSGNGRYVASTPVVLGDLPVLPPTTAQPSAPALIYADHDLWIQAGGQGAGILLVAGELKISGNFRFYGVIIATTVTITNSGNPMQIYGATLAGSFAATGAGGYTTSLSYDSCALVSAMALLPKTVLAFRELQY